VATKKTSANTKREAMKNFSEKELKQKVQEAQRALFEGKIKLTTGQLENTGLIWQTRKEIARLKTFLTQKSASPKSTGKTA
jgi:ribosomal protein L29